MSFDEFALICTYSVITVLSQAKSGLSFFSIFLMHETGQTTPSIHETKLYIGKVYYVSYRVHE